MQETLPEAQLAAALFVVQIVLFVSVAVGVFVSKYWTHRATAFPWRVGVQERQAGGMFDLSLLLIWFVLTLAPLTLTAINLSGWQTIGFAPPQIDVRTASFIALGSNLLVASWFVFRTGGWADSPFTSILVAIPTFAILLGESGERVFLYILYTVVLSGIFFTLNSELDFSGTNNQRDKRRLNLANWLLSSIMLMLTAWIGMFGAR